MSYNLETINKPDRAERRTEMATRRPQDGRGQGKGTGKGHGQGGLRTGPKNGTGPNSKKGTCIKSK